MSATKSTGEMAVTLRHVDKSYGFRKSKTAVLQQIDLDVPKGSIFGLLGPSGCGKTTLLNCIVGRRRVDNGTIRIFGQHPGSAKCGIPGSGVGYMPQELALMGDLTAKETLEYFGRIFKLNKNKIKERIDFLFEFLNIPKEWRLIKNLSGGQQRRVSFAIALLHEPPLLILDEPTVGVDPLLRMNVWKHLVDISQSGNITTIITTHYVEEAVLANRVGFMRDGRILTSGEPQSLLKQYQLSSLEDVFLHLCQRESSASKCPAICYYTNELTQCDDDSNTRMLQPSGNNNPLAITCQQQPVKYKCQSISMPSLNKILALVMKNFIKLRREWHVLIFQFLLPSILITLICLAISGNPHSLKIAVVNEDSIMGRKYLSLVDRTTIHQIAVPDINTAENMVIRGEAWGTIHIWRNFTMSSAKRLVLSQNVPKDVIRASCVHVRLDTTNILVTLMIKVSLVEALQNLGKSMDGTFGFDFNRETIPVLFDKPIYGTDNQPNLSEFVLPGTVVILVFFIAFGLTSTEFAQQQKLGLLDRSYVAGVNPIDLICSHFLSHLIVMIFQVGLVLFCLIVIFQFPCQGSIVLIVFLTLSQGFCGMACGYFISTLLQNEFAIVAAGLGGLFCSMVLSGVVWPIEGMPDTMVKFSHMMPQTYAVEALRSIFSRGWDFYFTAIWRGFLTSYAWTSVFIILSLISIRLWR